MFKKNSDLNERTVCLLSNKDVKKLRTGLSKHLNLNEDEVKEIFDKKSNVTQIKLVSRTLVYLLNNTPVLFDKEGRNNIYPTLYLLWKYPHALRNVVIHGPVSPFIMNGADLMLPGLAVTKSIK
jgi:translation initiation factor 2D